jgi:molybdate transport system substrate-binding protein
MMPEQARERAMRRGTRIVAAIVAGFLTVVIAGTAAKAAEVVLVTTDAVKYILLGLIPDFERTTGNTVRMSVYGTGLAVAKVKDGSEVPDLVLLSPEALGDLAKAGKIDGATITKAFRSRVGVAVRAGAPKPDVSTEAAFRQTLLNAKSIGHSIGPSGEFFSKVLIPRLGIGDAIKSKTTAVRGGPVAAAVARGEVEIGIHQIAELMPIAGIDIVGPLPPGVQKFTVFSAAVVAGSREPKGARELIEFLASPAAAPAIRDSGMEPIGAK